MSKESILITGASGFVGSVTTEKLGARAFRGDISKPSDWEENLRGGETIYLIAGVRTETELDLRTNTDSIDLLFNISKELKRYPKKLILASSQAVYMGNQPPFSELDQPHPTTIYGRSKLLGETLANRWCQQLEIPLVVLRYSTIIGPGIRENSNMSGPLFAWTKAALSGEPIEVFQDGNQTRDYVHVDDVVRVNVLAMDLPDGIYNVGGGESIKILQMAKWVKEATNSRSEIVVMGGGPSQNDPKEMLSDITKLNRLSWRPEKTTKEAVNEFVASFRDNLQVSGKQRL